MSHSCYAKPLSMDLFAIGLNYLPFHICPYLYGRRNGMVWLQNTPIAPGTFLHGGREGG